MTVLSPAEELGLSGLGLDSRVRKAMYAMPQAELVELFARMNEEARRRHLIYERNGVEETIRVMMRPIGVMPEQLSYLHYVSLTILNALKRLPDLYLQDAAVREIVPLSEPEERWLVDCWGDNQREFNPVLGRLDAVFDSTSPMWKDSLRYLEPNLCGVGGIHLGPTCEHMLYDVVLPALQKHDPTLQMTLGQDFREVFIQEMLDHLQAIGRPGQNICFVEPKYCGEGIDEQEPLAAYYRERHGLTIMHADPCELSIENGEVVYQGCRVDVAYRDYEVRDLIALEKMQGVDVEPLRQLFRENRMVSSAAGDFDHKSCWELFTDPQFTRKYFTAEERQVFRRHVLWTRVLRDRRTTRPDGETSSLVDYIRRHHDMFVLKPNRSYGGDRVVLGHLLEPAEWEAEVDKAVADPEPWVVQRLAALPVNEFPVLGDDGTVLVEPFYTVMGFAATRYGMAMIGRASQKQVVNVAQRGGMYGVLIGRPAGRLVGPS